MMKSVLIAAAALSGVSATELTPETYDGMTAGKTVFLKFFAPWCGHCKKMKPDWDKLMTEYADSKTVLVADVDCTAGGKPLCDANGVKGFPTLKHGDPANLEDYSGGRDAAAIAAFAAELKPVCSPSNMDLCDEEGKAAIEAVMVMSEEELTAAIAEADKKAADAEETFNSELEKLQETYKALMETKEDALAAVKASGVGMKKAVLAAKKASPAGKEEL